MPRKNFNPQPARMPLPADSRQPGSVDRAAAETDRHETSFFERNLPTVYKFFGPCTDARSGEDRRGNTPIPKSRLKVLVADEHRLVVDGLAALLRNAGYPHVAFGTDSEQVLRAFDTEPPDIAIVDYWLPSTGGLDVMRAVKSCRPPVPFILLAAGLTGSQAVDAVRLGVDGLLLKAITTEDLLGCIAAVSAGEQWLCPFATRLVLHDLAGGNGASRGLAAALTPRESDVVQGIARGRSNKELARDLLVTEGTIKMHLHNIYEKLGFRNRTELAIAARSNSFF